jgi:large subunit ribosomal protein L2
MGKRIISQARGHGSRTYLVRRSAYSYKPAYPIRLSGEWEVVNMMTEAGHTAPMIKLRNSEGRTFYGFAAKGIYVGKKITIGNTNIGDVAELSKLQNGTKVFNIELRPNDGGKLVRTGGNSATIMNNDGKTVKIMMPSKQEKIFPLECRATIGEIAGQGRLEKPILKAGTQFWIKKSRNKLWPRTSAVKMNIIDHPFGSGRGKRPKSKIVKRMASPGQKVGHLRPRRTGRTKK